MKCELLGLIILVISPSLKLSRPETTGSGRSMAVQASCFTETGVHVPWQSKQAVFRKPALMVYSIQANSISETSYYHLLNQNNVVYTLQFNANDVKIGVYQNSL